MTTEIRNQFIILNWLSMMSTLKSLTIRELDSKPNDEEKYKFLTEIYQHYFDYFVRDNMPIHNND